MSEWEHDSLQSKSCALSLQPTQPSQTMQLLLWRQILSFNSFATTWQAVCGWSQTSQVDVFHANYWQQQQPTSYQSNHKEVCGAALYTYCICSQFHASNSCQPTYSNQLANQLQNTHFSLVTSVSQGGHWLVCRSAWTRLLESVSQWLPETSIKHSQPVEEYSLGQSFMSQMEPNVAQCYWY